MIETFRGLSASRHSGAVLGTRSSFCAALVVTGLDPDFDSQGAARCDRVLAMDGFFLVGQDTKGCEVDTRSCKTIATAAWRGLGKRWMRRTTFSVTERAAVRVGGTKHEFERPPVRGAEWGAFAATKHLPFCEFERAVIAATKPLKQLAKCEAKFSS